MTHLDLKDPIICPNVGATLAVALDAGNSQALFFSVK